MEENKNFEEVSAENPTMPSDNQPINNEQPQPQSIPTYEQQNNVQNPPLNNIPPMPNQNIYNNFANQQAPVTSEPQKPKGFAIASMILGICSLVFGCCLWYIGLPCAIVGVCLGGISLKKKKGGKGMAIAGLVTSIVALGFAALAMIGLISFQFNTPYMSNNEITGNFMEGFREGLKSV
ncbi:MAG: DUF4190 domain-containing protein [Ruminococcus sp.]|nr:DUF4190 domain-containing protein [Ruminococcus sp.]